MRQHQDEFSSLGESFGIRLKPFNTRIKVKTDPTSPFFKNSKHYRSTLLPGCGAKWCVLYVNSGSESLLYPEWATQREEKFSKNLRNSAHRKSHCLSALIKKETLFYFQSDNTARCVFKSLQVFTRYIAYCSSSSSLHSLKCQNERHLRTKPAC